MNIIKINKLIMLFCTVLCIGACDVSNQTIPLCSDNLIEEVVDANNSPEIIKLWKKLQQERYVSETDVDQKTRPKFVGMQFILESVITSMLKSGLAEKATAVIYTSLPPTPLRVTDENVKQLVAPDVISDSERLDTISSRTIFLKDFLQNKGALYATYQQTDDLEKIPGMKEYMNNVKKYRALFDNPIETINKEFIGASYIIQCSNGQEVFFSIKSIQATDIKKSQWKLYYGSPFEHRVSGYFNTVQEVYKDAGINFAD